MAARAHCSAQYGEPLDVYHPHYRVKMFCDSALSDCDGRTPDGDVGGSGASPAHDSQFEAR